MKNLNWNALYQDATVVHCKNKYEVEEFLKLAEKKKIFFKKKDIYVDCFNIVKKSSNPLKFYKTGNTKHWTVINFKDLLITKKESEETINEAFDYLIAVHYTSYDTVLDDFYSITKSFHLQFEKISLDNLERLTNECTTLIKSKLSNFEELKYLEVLSWSIL